MPTFDCHRWHKAISVLDVPLQKQLELLKKSEKAHILRVYQAVCDDPALDSCSRHDLILLALLHDIGKTITRPSLLFKITKVFFNCANTEHCVAGARILRRHRQNSTLIKRVLRHHDSNTEDLLLCAFQKYDDHN